MKRKSELAGSYENLSPPFAIVSSTCPILPLPPSDAELAHARQCGEVAWLCLGVGSWHKAFLSNVSVKIGPNSTCCYAGGMSQSAACPYQLWFLFFFSFLSLYAQLEILNRLPNYIKH